MLRHNAFHDAMSFMTQCLSWVMTHCCSVLTQFHSWHNAVHDAMSFMTKCLSWQSWHNMSSIAFNVVHGSFDRGKMQLIAQCRSRKIVMHSTIPLMVSCYCLFGTKLQGHDLDLGRIYGFILKYFITPPPPPKVRYK